MLESDFCSVTGLLCEQWNFTCVLLGFFFLFKFFSPPLESVTKIEYVEYTEPHCVRMLCSHT